MLWKEYKNKDKRIRNKVSTHSNHKLSQNLKIELYKNTLEINSNGMKKEFSTYKTKSFGNKRKRLNNVFSDLFWFQTNTMQSQTVENKFKKELKIV